MKKQHWLKSPLL